MIAKPVHVEEAMLMVPLNLPSLPVPTLPPQTASSSPSSTGNTRRDGPNDRLDNSHLSPEASPHPATRLRRRPDRRRTAHPTVVMSSTRCSRSGGRPDRRAASVGWQHLDDQDSCAS